MGYFHVLSAPGQAQATFTVRQAHLNLWALPGLAGRVVLDVGLLVKAGEESLDAVHLMVPGRTSDMKNLAGELMDAKVAQLIFAQRLDSVLSSPELRLDLGSTDQPNVETVRLLSTQAEVETPAPATSDQVTVWKIGLVPALTLGQTGYLRVRFSYETPGRLLTWRRVLGRRNGALVDVRVADPREAVVGDRADELGQRSDAVTIDSLYTFVMVSDRFRLGSGSPGLEYRRLLEGAAWTKYQPYAQALGRGSRYVVYYWRERAPVSTQRPFRGFLQLERQPSFVPTSDLLVAALVVVAALGVVFYTDAVGEALGDASSAVTDLWGAATAIGVTAIALVAFLWRAQRARGRVRSWYQSLEDRVIIALRGPDN
jgi:hypothetical protein